MGHQRLGILPRTRKWKTVIALIAGGADAEQVAAATSEAAERELQGAAQDPAFVHAFWLLTQIPLAARQPDFARALQNLGLEVDDQPSVIDIARAFSDAVDERARNVRRRTDLGEMAQMCGAEALYAVAGRDLNQLFGTTSRDVQAAFAGLTTVKQFSSLSMDFFARLTRRVLGYFLSRELPNHVGANSRFHTIREHRDFEEALDQHCRETARIVGDFSGEWYSKTNYESGIEPKQAGNFARVAFDKIKSELQHRRDAYA